MHDFIKYRKLRHIEIDSFRNLFYSAFYPALSKLRSFKRLLHPTKRRLIQSKMEAIFNSSKFIIAYDKDNENLIYGFIAYASHKNYFYLNFAYVKKDFRGIGIFKDMFDSIYDGEQKFYILPSGEIKTHSFFKDFKFLKGAL